MESAGMLANEKVFGYLSQHLCAASSPLNYTAYEIFQWLEAKYNITLDRRVRYFEDAIAKIVALGTADVGLSDLMIGNTKHFDSYQSWVDLLRQAWRSKSMNDHDFQRPRTWQTGGKRKA